jgi:amino acid permease
MLSNPYPHELALGDVYFTPVLAVLVFAFLAAVITVGLMDRLKLSRWFYAPSYVFLAILLLYMILIDYFWIKF